MRLLPAILLSLLFTAIVAAIAILFQVMVIPSWVGAALLLVALAVVAAFAGGSGR